LDSRVETSGGKDRRGAAQIGSGEGGRLEGSSRSGVIPGYNQVVSQSLPSLKDRSDLPWIRTTLSTTRPSTFSASLPHSYTDYHKIQLVAVVFNVLQRRDLFTAPQYTTARVRGGVQRVDEGSTSTIGQFTNILGEFCVRNRKPFG